MTDQDFYSFLGGWLLGLISIFFAEIMERRNSGTNASDSK